jgi:hypothetical protein
MLLSYRRTDSDILPTPIFSPHQGDIMHGTRVRPEPDLPSATTTSFDKHRMNAAWINAAILIGSGIFVFGLVLSAVFAPEWRVLHSLQTLIYVALVALTRRQSAFGFGAGVGVAAFWNSLGIFATTFMRAGVRQLWSAIRTGSAPRLDILLQVLAFGGHILIIIACLIGFFRIRPGVRQWVQFLAGGGLVIAYLFAIVFATGPPASIALFRQVLGL